jgi:hypothetical protein
MDKIRCNSLKLNTKQLKILIDADMKVNELIGICKKTVNEYTADWNRQNWANFIIDIVGKNTEYTVNIIQRAAAQMFSIYKA